MRRICVTGPESTGKTTLVEHLARSLCTEWVPEASRLYAERIGRALTEHDVEPIAREHVAMAVATEARVTSTGGQRLLLDTDLISTSLYGRYYYGFSSSWIDTTARARLADLYLLCNVDVPWVPDGVRDQPDARESMFALFRETLASFGASVVTIHGGWTEREEIADRAIRDLFAPR